VDNLRTRWERTWKRAGLLLKVHWTIISLETIAAHETLRLLIARPIEAAGRLPRASEGFCGSANTISWMKERGCGRIKAAALM